MPGIPVTKNTTLKLSFDGDLLATQYSENMGTATVAPGPVNVAPSAIPTEEAFGTPTVTPITYITTSGIASDEAFGTPQLNLVVAPVAIDSSEEFGTPTIVPGAVVISGAGDIASSEAFGLASILFVIGPSGIATREAFGTPRVKLVTETGVIVITGAPPYRVVIADLNGVELEEIPAKNLQYSFALNESGACNFVLPLRDSKSTTGLIAPGQREIHVYRDGVRVWGGYMWYVGASSNEPTIRVAGEGYFSRLLRRVITERLVYEDVDQFQIAWNLINWTQTQPKTGANLGITRFSTANSGVVRTRRYKEWERHNVGEVLQSFAELDNGFDFEIDPDKRWKNYYPNKGADNNVIFELGKNIDSISYDVDAANTVSELSGLGAGQDRNRCIVVISDATALGQFGLVQDVEDFGEIKHYDTLFEATTESLRLRKQVRQQPQVMVITDDPPFDAYSIGDTIRLRAKMGYIDLDKDFRLVAQNVQVSDEGREANQLFFDTVPAP